MSIKVISGEATSHFSKVPLVMTLRRLTMGRKSARLYLLRVILANFLPVFAGAYFIDSLLFAGGIDLTPYFSPLYAFVGSYITAFVAATLGITFGRRPLGNITRRVLQAFLLVLFVISALLVLVYSSALFRLIPLLREPLYSSSSTFGGDLLIRGAFWTMALVGVVLELGAVEYQEAKEVQAAIRAVARRGLFKLARGLPTLSNGIVSLVLVPLWLRWTEVTVADTPASPEQLENILSKIETPFSTAIEHDVELERDLTGYYLTLSFQPPLLFVSVIGNKTIVVYFKLPVRFPFVRTFNETYSNISDQVTKFDQANFSCSIDMKFIVSHVTKGSALLHVDEVHQTLHEGTNFYDHSYTETLMPKARDVELRDFFYKRPPLLEGSVDVPVLKVQARRDSCGLESSTFVTSYDAEIYVTTDGETHTIEVPFEMLMPYKSIVLNLEVVLRDGHEVQSTDPRASWSGPHQAAFNFRDLKPTSKIIAKIRFR